MRSLRRRLDAFVALPARLRLPAAVALALLAHLLFFLVMWLAPILADWLHLSALFPDTPPPAEAAAPTPKPQKLELAAMEVTERPKPTPANPTEPAPPEPPLTAAESAKLQQLFQELPEEQKQEYIDVEGLAKRKNLSQRALFESWRDSVAGSRKPGANPNQMPSQDGRTDIPFAGFKNQQANAVDPKTFEESDAKGPSQPAANAQMPAQAPNIFKPKPVQKNDLAPTARPTQATAQAAPTPPPPPPPSAPQKNSAGELDGDPDRKKRDPGMQVVSLGEKDVPLFVLGFSMRKTAPALPVPPEPVEPAPKPTPPPVNKPTPSPPVAKATPTPASVSKPTPPPTTVAKLTPPQKPAQMKTPNYASHMEMRKTEGGGPEGEGGVDAIATERGKYKKMMKMMVESRWLPAVRSRGDLIQTGTVAIRFAIDGQGRLTKFKVDYNTSNNAHAMVVEAAMRATKFDAPPSEMLRSGVFEDEFTFTLY